MIKSINIRIALFFSRYHNHLFVEIILYSLYQVMSDHKSDMPQITNQLVIWGISHRTAS